MNEGNYDDYVINEWADKNNYKITNINVCPSKWYMNDSKTGISEIDLIITVIYHKKRTRKKVNE